MVQGWVKSCDERPREPGSAHCCALNPTVPTRLIDVSGAPQKLRLINTGGKAHAPYAALSYCWGEAQPLLTTKHTLAQHKEDIPITKLPWTFLDAVKTAKWLNLKYIWIDALCIVQDSEEDREHEIARMQHVFQNSYVTIVAARASSCGDGFLKADNLWNPLATLPVRCEGGDTGNMLLTAKKGHQLPRDGSPLTTREPLHERGWTLQEVVLSPRVLIYTHDSIVWKCFCHDKGLVYNSLTGQAFGRDWNGYCASAGLTTMRLCPSGEVLQPSVTVTMPSFLLLDPSSQQPGGGSKLTRAQARLHQLYRIWEFLVQDYSTRRLTRPDDKLPALAGLATYFQRALNDVYIAGLWKGHFVHELCWTVDAKRAAALGGAERPESPWRAPSWSWMSIDGPVAFEANRHTLFESRIARFRCEVEPLTPGAPYSRLRSGFVEIAGLMLPYDATEDCRIFFDAGGGCVTGYGGGGAVSPGVLSPSVLSPGGHQQQQDQSSELWLLLVATCQTFSSQKRQGNLLPSGSIWGLMLREVEGGEGRREGETFERVGHFTGGWRAAQQFPGNERQIIIV
ncbi:heterokaryon incompatibility protein-domain-containing protein [Macrophomina phaseolina]|uniref:Heterokaryon incompatibility protein-domain-containing protein n=1 Tax=Macrophomina phaseolina TaxID=35725 RepID=A0ABQ8GW90_9PEZI|nr:heterokaryon incompatibility protein-domain-containing protein [Macrophomina phaseolina]